MTIRPRRVLALALAASLLSSCAATRTTDGPALAVERSPAEIIDAASESEWIDIAPEDLLILEWEDKASSRTRRAVIRLMDIPYGAAWSRNVRALARAGHWEEAAIYRVIPDFVTQWGLVPPEGEAASDQEQPAYLEPIPPGSFTAPLAASGASEDLCKRTGSRLAGVCDAFAPQVRMVEGWVMGSDGETTWPLACRGMVGVARVLAPSQGNAATLFAMHTSTRRILDRNLGFVGRVIEGMDALTDLPAGTGPNGVYAGAQEAPIAFTRGVLASQLPESERPRFRYLDPSSASYRALLDAYTRPSEFYTLRYDALDACAELAIYRPVES